MPTSAERLYLDSSAIVKLVVREAETEALQRLLQSHPDRVSCALVRVEVPLAVRAHGTEAVTRARVTVGRLRLLRLTGPLLDRASHLTDRAQRETSPLVLDAPLLHSLDAIHVAAALRLRVQPVVVTYDRRMTEAARAQGLEVVAPGA